MPEMEFEIHLEKTAKDDKVLNKIERDYGITLVTPITQSSSMAGKNTELRKCYLVKKEVSEDDVWPLATGIKSLNGVRDVDPDVTVPCVREPESDELDFTGYSNFEIGWSKQKTKFKEAEDYAIKQRRTAGGKGIRIAQLDTGYTNHPEIKNILKTQGYDICDDDPDPRDTLTEGILKQPSHGTSTASVIIGSGTDHTGNEPIGVAPLTSLIPFRISKSVLHVLNGQSIVKGVEKAIESNCKVINLSMGGAPPRISWRIAAEQAYMKGIIWVCAAGNVVGWVVWPAKYRETIAVAATNFVDLPWERSSLGTRVDISAPGHQVYVATTEKNRTYSYKFGRGTSYAAPHVAAAAAVWLAFHGKDLDSYKEPWQRVEAFRKVLKKSANKPNYWDTEKWGAGMLDVEALLKQPLPKLRELTRRRFTRSMVDVDMVHKEIIYNIVNAENENKLDSAYIFHKSSQDAKARMYKKLIDENAQNESNEARMKILKNAFLIGL